MELEVVEPLILCVATRVEPFNLVQQVCNALSIKTKLHCGDRARRNYSSTPCLKTLDFKVKVKRTRVSLEVKYDVNRKMKGNQRKGSETATMSLPCY